MLLISEFTQRQRVHVNKHQIKNVRKLLGNLLTFDILFNIFTTGQLMQQRVLRMPSHMWGQTAIQQERLLHSQWQRFKQQTTHTVLP